MKTIRFLSLACLLAGTPLLSAEDAATVIYETDFQTAPQAKDMWLSGNEGGGGGELRVASDEKFASALMFFNAPFELAGNKFKATWKIDSLGSESHDNPQAQLRFAVAPAPVQPAEPYELPNVVTLTVARDNSTLKVALYEKVEGGAGFGKQLYEGMAAADDLPMEVSLELTVDTFNVSFDKPVETVLGSPAGSASIARSGAFTDNKLQTFLKLVNLGEARANTTFGGVSFSLSKDAGGN